jgi:hypothetical protein
VEDNIIIDSEKAGVVDFATRMVRLKEFCGPRSGGSGAPAIKDVKAWDKDVKTSSTMEHERKQAVIPACYLFGGRWHYMVGYEGPPKYQPWTFGCQPESQVFGEADKLYCEEIDVGEDEPRSALSAVHATEDMEGRHFGLVQRARKLVGFRPRNGPLCINAEPRTSRW